MRKYILIIGLIINSAWLNSQWVSNYWGNGQGDEPVLNSTGIAVASDAEGNSYVTGFTSNNISGYDILLIKYNQSGDTLFTRVFNGNGNGTDKAFGIVVDEDGSIYIIGQAAIAGKGLELILLKYSNTGSLAWTRTYGGTVEMKDDLGKALALDKQHNIYVTGYVTGSDDHKDIVIMKFRPDGTMVWNKIEDGEGGLDSEGLGIAVDEKSSVYITGYTTNGNDITKTDIITQKFNSNGSVKWTRLYNGGANGLDKAFGISIDDADNIYVTGYTTIETSPLNTSAITIKYKNNGDQKWIKTYESGLPGSLDKAWGIVIDEDRIYITGQTTNQNNQLDYLTARYTTSGSLVWDTPYDGPGHGDDYSNAITVLHNGKVAVTGASWGSNNNFDYATLIMNKNTGNILDYYRYSMSGSSNDIANDVSTSNNNVFVTGYSETQQSSPADGGASALSTLMYLGGDKQANTLANVPGEFKLYQNYPNPFNPETTIKFDITEKSTVKLLVYDMLGKVVDVIIDQQLEAGNYSMTYKNNKLSSGIYFYQLTAGSFTDVKKMSLIK